MPLEQVNYSQVVTFEPQLPQWTLPVLLGGTAAPAAATWPGPFGSYPYIVAGSLSTGSTAQPGDKFQLYTSGTLKESTVFTVAGLTPSTGYSSWNVFFLPQPQVNPTSSDTAISVPAPKNGRWLGQLGHVKGLTRSYSVPGGPDQLTLTLLTPPDFRTDALNPGRVVQAWRGGSCVWEGKLDEPVPTGDGWTVSAHGAGQYGADFAAIYSTWSSDDPVNQAISRGLRWTNPGIGSSGGIWLGQQQDSGSENITDHLNLLITGGGVVWKVTRGNASSIPAGPWTLSVTAFPSDANGNPLQSADRLLICTTPVPRTVAADINTIWLRYMVTADTTSKTGAAVPATFALTSVSNNGSVLKHGPMEYFLDLSSAGVMSVSAAQTVGTNILTRFVRASFAGPFTAMQGQVLNAAGQPVDLGCDEAGLVYQVIMTDAPYGGEVAAGPLLFISGGYQYDEDTQTATITPYQGVRGDLASLISAMYPSSF